MVFGAILMFCSVLCFTAYSISIQWFHLYPPDLILGRGICQVVVFGLILLFKGDYPNVTKETLGLGILSFWSTVGFIFVIHHLPLGAGVILTRSSPPFAAIFAWFILKEPFWMIDGFCTVTLFLGQILVVQPSIIMGNGVSEPLEGFDECLAIFFGLLCSATYGLLFVLGSMYKTPTEHFGLIGSLMCMVSGLIMAPVSSKSQIFHSDPEAVFPTVLLKVAGTSGIGAMVTILVLLSLGKCPPLLQSQILSLECAISMVAQVLILKQEVTWPNILGAIIVGLSLVAATLVHQFTKVWRKSYSDLSKDPM